MPARQDDVLWWIKRMKHFLEAFEFNAPGQQEVWHKGVIIVRKDTEDSIYVTIETATKVEDQSFVDDWKAVIEDVWKEALAVGAKKITVVVFWGIRKRHKFSEKVYDVNHIARVKRIER